jgi:uncharacterized repeat protein (TIGR01451 family)
MRSLFMNLTGKQKIRRTALAGIFSFGLLIILLFTSFNADWGIAYGQTVSPTEPPIIDKFDPAVAKTANPTDAPVGSEVTFTITVSNPGSLPANGVVSTDDVPNEFEVVGATTTKGTTSTTGQTVRVEIGTLAPGEVVTIVINTRVRAGVNNNGATLNRVRLTATTGDGRVIEPTAVAGVRVNPTSGGGGQGGPGTGAPGTGAPGTGAPGSVIPGLPNTGTSMANDESFSWKMGGLIFSVIMLIGSLGAFALTSKPDKPKI